MKWVLAAQTAANATRTHFMTASFSLRNWCRPQCATHSRRLRQRNRLVSAAAGSELDPPFEGFWAVAAMGPSQRPRLSGPHITLTDTFHQWQVHVYYLRLGNH